MALIVTTSVDNLTLLNKCLETFTNILLELQCNSLKHMLRNIHKHPVTFWIVTVLYETATRLLQVVTERSKDIEPSRDFTVKARGGF